MNDNMGNEFDNEVEVPNYVDNSFDGDTYSSTDTEGSTSYQESSNSLEDEEKEKLNKYRKIVNIWCIITVSLFIFFLFYFLLRGEL